MNNVPSLARPNRLFLNTTDGIGLTLKAPLFSGDFSSYNRAILKLHELVKDVFLTVSPPSEEELQDRMNLIMAPVLTLDQENLTKTTSQICSKVRAINFFEECLLREDEVDDNGINFFEKCFLKGDHIDPASKELILEGDTNTFSFVVFCTMNLFVFGSEREVPPPSFFSLDMREKIEELRKRYFYQEVPDFGLTTVNYKCFLNPQDYLLEGDDFLVFNDFERASYLELRSGDPFLILWAAAIKNFKKSSPYTEVS